VTIVVVVVMSGASNAVCAEEITLLCLKFVTTKKLAAVHDRDWFERLVLRSRWVLFNLFTDFISVYYSAEDGMLLV